MSRFLTPLLYYRPFVATGFVRLFIQSASAALPFRGNIGVSKRLSAGRRGSQPRHASVKGVVGKGKSVLFFLKQATSAPRDVYFRLILKASCSFGHRLRVTSHVVLPPFFFMQKERAFIVMQSNEFGSSLI